MLQERHGDPGACPEKGSRAMRDLEHKYEGERLREVGLFRLGKSSRETSLLSAMT